MPTAPCFYIKVDGDVIGQIELSRFPFVIGRARECDYVLDTDGVSRQHLQIDFNQRQIVVRDLESRNGTFMNLERMIPNQNYLLRANDHLTIADTLTLIFDDPATTSQLDLDHYLNVGLRVDVEKGEGYINDVLLDPPLSPSQILLLQLLLRNEGVVVTREEIRQHVWGEGMMVSDQAMDALVSRLRKRLHEADSEHEYITTRRGFGLIFHNRRPGMPPPNH